MIQLPDSAQKAPQQQLKTFESENASILMQEKLSQQMESAISSPQLLLSPSMIQDVGLLRKQVTFFSKTSLALSKKLLQQQEKLTQAFEAVERYREGVKTQESGDQHLRSQIERLKSRQKYLEQELKERDRMIKQSAQQEKRAATIRQNKLHEIQQRSRIMFSKNEQQDDLLQQKQQQLGLKQAQIARLKDRISHLQNQDKQKDFNKEDFSNAEMKAKQSQLKQLQQKHKALRNNYYQMKIEYSYIKERLQNLTTDQRDVEHLVIDNFIRVMDIMKEKLEKGEIKNVQEELENKMKSMFRKMKKEYQIFIDKK